MCLLLLLISVNPNFSGVFLSCDLFVLLDDFIQELFPLNLILFLNRLLLNVENVSFALCLPKLPHLVFKFPLVVIHEEVLLVVVLLDDFVLCLQVLKVLFDSRPDIIGCSKTLGQLFVVILDPRVVTLQAFVLDGQN